MEMSKKVKYNGSEGVMFDEGRVFAALIGGTGVVCQGG